MAWKLILCSYSCTGLSDLCTHPANCIHFSLWLQLCLTWCFANVWLCEVNQLKRLRSTDWNTNRGPREIRLINSSRWLHLKLQAKKNRETESRDDSLGQQKLWPKEGNQGRKGQLVQVNKMQVRATAPIVTGHKLASWVIVSFKSTLSIHFYSQTPMSHCLVWKLSLTTK